MSPTVEVVAAPDNEPMTVATTAELDAVLDRLAAEASLDVPPLIALDMPDQQRSMLVGLRGPVGVLNFVDFSTGRGSASKADTIGVQTPPYFYCGEWTGVPADAELPIEVVRQAAREFLDTGERPNSITWQ